MAFLLTEAAGGIDLLQRDSPPGAERRAPPQGRPAPSLRPFNNNRSLQLGDTGEVTDHLGRKKLVPGANGDRPIKGVWNF